MTLIIIFIFFLGCKFVEDLCGIKIYINGFRYIFKKGKD